jgi:hypothetical protein
MYTAYRVRERPWFKAPISDAGRVIRTDSAWPLFEKSRHMPDVGIKPFVVEKMNFCQGEPSSRKTARHCGEYEPNSFPASQLFDWEFHETLSRRDPETFPAIPCTSVTMRPETDLRNARRPLVRVARLQLLSQ